MKITKQEIEHLAKLSRLDFSEQELATFTVEFESVLNQMALINKTDTSGVDLKSTPISAEKELRADTIGVSLEQSDVVSNASHEMEGAFLVPATVE